MRKKFGAWQRRVILSAAKNPFPSGVVGCGVPNAPQKRNDPFHRAVEDAGPYGVGVRRRMSDARPYARERRRGCASADMSTVNCQLSTINCQL